MTDTSSFDMNDAPDTTIDDALMPGTRAPSAPLYPNPGKPSSAPGETGGFTPQADKVFSPDLFDERRRQRLAIVNEGLAREVMGDDANKWQKAARLARKYNLDPSLVTPNLTEFEIKDLADRFGTATPKVRNFLGADKVNALLGYDDIANLNATESLLQNIFEAPKGVPKGVGSTLGMAMQGAGANAAAFERSILATMDRIDAGEVIPGDQDPLGYASMTPNERAEIRKTIEAAAAVPIKERSWVKAGRDLPGQFDVFPAAKGYEDSIGRQLGEGVGSVIAGLAVSAVASPAGSMAVFSLAGSGEAVDRAIEAGATEAEIIEAAKLGYLPGMTDSIPVETLLGRLPIPGGKFLKVPAGMLGKALKGVGRIGWQAFLEGAQEGGQTFLQNLIAREVYKPDQSLTEGLPGDAGIGGGVGGLTQLAKEAITLIGGRRARGGVHLREVVAETRVAQTAENNATSLADAMQRVQASPLTERDPERMKALISDIAGQDGRIYMPAEEAVRLYQDGIISDRTLSEWGVLDQMMEIRATGGDLIIPAANFLTSTVGKEAIPELARSVRTSAASMTAREAEAFNADRQARVEAILERMAIEQENKPDGAYVYEQVREALAKTKQFSESETKAYAALTTDRYLRRAADRAGLSADALFVRDNFQIVGPQLEETVRRAVKDELDVVIARLMSGREVKTPKTPVLDILKKRGGVDPQSPLARDLLAMGLTAKSNPGLFKATGLKAADNIVASEERVLTDNGIAVDQNGYAQPDALMAAVREEIAGRPWQTQEEKDRIARLDAPVAELQKIMDKAGFDYRNASAEAVRAFLETQLQDAPVLEGQTEAAFDQEAVPGSPAFQKDVQHWQERLAALRAGKVHRSHDIRLGRTPAVLRLLGFDKSGVVMRATKAAKAMVEHPEVPKAVWDNLPVLMADPLYVFPSGKGDGSVVVVLEAKTAKGDPIIVPVLAEGVDAAGQRRNVVLSLYARGESNGVSGEQWIANAVRAALRRGETIYAREGRGSAVLRTNPGPTSRGGQPSPTSSRDAGGQSRAGKNVVSRDDLINRFSRVYYQAGKSEQYQPDGTGMFKRGSFERQRSPYGDIVNIIRLTKNADRSTFLHESGHFWYHQLVEDAFDPEVMPEARERLQADLQTTLKWFGLDLDVKSSTPEQILSATTTEMHEQFARGAEAYFMEGKAPSLELRKLFAKFSGWLISIYRKLKTLNVELNDDVRGVFDRLLATEEAIQEAADKRMYAVPTDLAKSLTAAEKAQIERLAEEAKVEARIQLQGQVAREIQREKTKAWAEEKARVTEAMTLAVRRRPVYAALNLMRNAQNAAGEAVTNEDGSARSFKLNRKEMTDRYGEEIVSLLPSGIWARNGSPAVSVDVMASLAGFDSADALKLALMQAKDATERDMIREEVDAEMKRRHGDLLANVEEEAAKAVANDKQLELMALQARLLKRIAGDRMSRAAEQQAVREGAAPLSTMREGVRDTAQTTDAVERSGAPAEAALPAQVAEQFARTAQDAQRPMRAAQAAAQATVARMGPKADQVGAIKEAAKVFVQRRKVRDLGQPEMYERQAARQTRQIEKLIAGRKYQEAQILMEQRLFNAQMAVEVRNAQETVETVRTYLDKFDGRKVRERIGKAENGYLEQIDGLLEAYEFKRASDAFLDRKQSLADWLRGQEASGNVVPEVPESVMRRLKAINYREIPFGELTDLRDAVKSIEHVAREHNKLMREQEKRAMEELEAEAVASIEANVPPLPPNFNPQRDGFGADFAKNFVNIASLLTKTQTWFAKMDGADGKGFFFSTVLAPIRRAQIARLKRLEQAGAKFDAIIRKHYGGKGKFAGNKVAIPEIGVSLTLEERLAVALNWGNESNREALLNDKSRGRENWGASGYNAILDTLTKRDWDFVQATWDYVNEFWPEIAALQKKRTGLAPAKVEPSAVETRFGTYRGGYYPLQYDPRSQVRTQEQSLDELFKGVSAGRFASAATKRGHTIARTGSGGQSVMLSLGVINNHITQVVTDLTMGPAISDAWKLLNRPKLKQVIANHMGVDVVNGLDMWIKDTAVGQIRVADGFSKTLRGLRSSVSVAAMGWKLGTTLMQVSGFMHTAAQVGKRNTAVALGKFASNPVGSWRQVMSLSPMMQERARTFQRDVADALAQAKDIGGIKGRMISIWFLPIAKMQLTVDIPTWMAGYSRAVKDGLTGQAAVDFADNAVIGAQSSSLFSELSAFERGSLSSDKRLSEMTKLWGTFYSYFNTKLNLAMRRTQATDFRNPLQVINLIADYAMIFWLEAVVTELIRDLPNWMGDDDDKEERDFWQVVGHHLGLTFHNAMGTVPLLREISAALQGFDAGPGASRGLADVAKGGKNAAKAVNAMFSEDEDVNWFSVAKSTVALGNVISPFKYPAGQINNIISGFEKADKGDDVTWIDYLMAKPKK